MKKVACLIASLFCAPLNAHCPCSGSKPCDPSKPCNHCAQEQAQTRGVKPAAPPVRPSPPPPPAPLSAAARKHLERIKAKAARTQKKVAQHTDAITFKLAYTLAQLAKDMEHIENKFSWTIKPPKPMPLPAPLIAPLTPPELVPLVPVVAAPQVSEPTAPVQQEPQPETTLVTPVVIEPAPTVTPPAITPVVEGAPTVQVDDDKTELEWALIKSIASALTPLIAAYPTERLIPAEPTALTLDEQLDQMHLIATFVTKLKIKLEGLTQPERDFIKTASFAGNPIARMLARNILSLQSYFESQLASYKQFKPQPTLVKELKKLTTSCAKEVDALCKELLHA